MKEYDKLLELARETATLGSIQQLLEWDQETYMPEGGAAARAGQMQLMARLVHQRATGKAFEKALAALIDLDTGKVQVSGLTPERQAALREWRLDFLRATKLPTPFVEQTAGLISQSLEGWRAAREGSSFARFAPFLERLIDNARQRAEYLGYEDHPFDALVDEHEPKMTTRKIGTLFKALKEELIPFRNKLISGKRPPRDFFHKHYGHSKQMEFARKLLNACGFTEETGVIALTTHPFCTGIHPTDTRLSTRVDEKDPLANWLATVHEGGHWLYETSLPTQHFGTPLAQALSTGMHESQSRWWETLMGQSLPFWTFFYPELKRTFPKQLEGISLNKFYKGLNAILDTPIRVNSDEVSYPLHIVLRFEIERDLISGKLPIRDLPEVWNSKMHDYLQINPKNESEGCLQDVHWAAGLFGYFPTYTLGNLYAAQLFDTFKAENREWDKRIAKGEFAFVREWLRTHVHQHGRRYPADQLVKRITGSDLTSASYLAYIKNKYNNIYS